MSKLRVYCMYGLGGRIWSAGIEDVVAARIRKALPQAIVPATRNYTDWQSIVADIKATPNDKHVVIGHSLGAVMATKVTDFAKVDLLVLYDLAGAPPSMIGKNTGRVIDIYDTYPDMVPEWRVQALPGHEQKIERRYSSYGHTGQDDSTALANQVVGDVRKIVA